jgi:hypothetical protein
MTSRNFYPERDIEDRSAEVLRRRSIPLFMVLIGLLAAMNVASVVSVLLE